MVVNKVENSKKQNASSSKKKMSMNGSGVWEVETMEIAPKQAENQTGPKFRSSRFAQNDDARFSPYHPHGGRPQDWSRAPAHFDSGPRAPRRYFESGPHAPRQQLESGSHASRQPFDSGLHEPRQHCESDPPVPRQHFEPAPPAHDFEAASSHSKRYALPGPHLKRRSEPKEPKKLSPCYGWSNADILDLVCRVEEHCADFISLEYSEGIKKVNWSEISFNGHTASDCETVWNYLFQKARTPRELIHEARKLLLGKRPRGIITSDSSENHKSNNPLVGNGSLVTRTKNAVQDEEKIEEDRHKLAFEDEDEDDDCEKKKDEDEDNDCEKKKKEEDGDVEQQDDDEDEDEDDDSEEIEDDDEEEESNDDDEEEEDEDEVET